VRPCSVAATVNVTGFFDCIPLRSTALRMTK
jgi:hypothetical protein